MAMPVNSRYGLRSVGEGEGQQIWAGVPYVLNLEENEYPIGYVLRTHASARIPDWPTTPDGTVPETDIEVTLLPGADKTETISLLQAEELDYLADGPPYLPPTKRMTHAPF